MSNPKQIQSVLISVYHKENLNPLLEALQNHDIDIYSTGGTHSYISDRGLQAEKVEDITGYPSILGGRVKTLHPKVFGGLLARKGSQEDLEQLEEYEIPSFDAVIVDLYPFEEAWQQTNEESELIEQIDIGGISLIRAAAKNYRDVLVIPSQEDFATLINVLEEDAQTSIEQRKELAAKAFHLSSHYDTTIFNYFNEDVNYPAFQRSYQPANPLRYGENPHQQGTFFGSLEDNFEKISGKELSYNNLVDVDAAISLCREFDPEEGCTFIVIKHTNSCGVAARETVYQAWKDAFAGDPKSAFGGIYISNHPIDKKTAESIHEVFYEVLLAPDFTKGALDVLTQKKKRILLKFNPKKKSPPQTFKPVLDGVLEQDEDFRTETKEDFNVVTEKDPTEQETQDLIFANKVVKHLKSNAIAIVKDRQLVGSGMGQPSRVDALQQAIQKAQNYDLPLSGAVMASDAFFPFADSVEIAHQHKVDTVIQPGGSIRDDDSIEYCNENDMSMVFTGYRHFKH